MNIEEYERELKTEEEKLQDVYDEIKLIALDRQTEFDFIQARFEQNTTQSVEKLPYQYQCADCGHTGSNFIVTAYVSYIFGNNYDIECPQCGCTIVYGP